MSEILLTVRISGNALGWVKKFPPKSFFNKLFLETRSLLVPIMSTSAKNLLEGLKGSECKRGNIVNRPPIPYVQPLDPNEKQEKTKIKIKVPDGTNYQMVPFQAGTNESYTAHIIAAKQLLEQKEMEENVEKAFVAVTAMRLREACNFVLTVKVTSNKIYSYFHLASDDKDIIFVNKVSMLLIECCLGGCGLHPVILNLSRPSCLVVLVVDRR